MAQFSLSNMRCKTLLQPGKCPPLDDHIYRRWERSRPMEFSHISSRDHPYSIMCFVIFTSCDSMTLSSVLLVNHRAASESTSLAKSLYIIPILRVSCQQPNLHLNYVASIKRRPMLLRMRNRHLIP